MTSILHKGGEKQPRRWPDERDIRNMAILFTVCCFILYLLTIELNFNIDLPIPFF